MRPSRRWRTPDLPTNLGRLDRTRKRTRVRAPAPPPPRAQPRPSRKRRAVVPSSSSNWASRSWSPLLRHPLRPPRSTRRRQRRRRIQSWRPCERTGVGVRAGGPVLEWKRPRKTTTMQTPPLALPQMVLMRRRSRLRSPRRRRPWMRMPSPNASAARSARRTTMTTAAARLRKRSVHASLRRRGR